MLLGAQDDAVLMAVLVSLGPLGCVRRLLAQIVEMLVTVNYLALRLKNMEIESLPHKVLSSETLHVLCRYGHFRLDGGIHSATASTSLLHRSG